MSAKENVKSRADSRSQEPGKPSLSRSSSPQNQQPENAGEQPADADSPHSFRAIKPRLLASMADKAAGPSKSAAAARKPSGQPAKRGSAQAQPAAEAAAASPSAEDSAAIQPPPTAAAVKDESDQAQLTALENEKLRNRLEFVVRKNKQLTEEKERIQRDRDESMRNIEDLLSQNRELTAENTTMKEQRQLDARAIEELRKQTKAQEQRIHKLKEENRMLNESNLKATRELQAAGQEKSDLGESFRAQHAELKRLTADRQGDQLRLEQSEQRLVKVKADYQTATKQIEVLRAEIKKYKEAVDELRAENKRLKGRRDDAKPKGGAGRAAKK